MLILNAADVHQAFPMSVAVATMKTALMAISDDQVNMPVRTRLDSEQHRGTTFVMPAHVQVHQGEKSLESLAVKVVSVFDNNRTQRLPRVQAAVLVLDPQTGQPIGLLEGASITAIRTAAASGAATDALASEGCSRLALIGSGAQARSHMAAMKAVRPIEQVWIAARNPTSGQSLLADLQSSFPGVSFQLTDANTAVAQAEIVCTVTNSADPVFDADAMTAGTHVNAIGSYRPEVAEIPARTVVESRVFVDHLESAWEEAGELIQALQAKLIDKRHVLGEVGQVLNRSIPGRVSEEDITLFKSVGNAAEDALAAAEIFARANQMGLGSHVDW